ncbi:MAG: class I SAM-dependent methyltransferase [Sporichthyaceae bacterium]
MTYTTFGEAFVPMQGDESMRSAERVLPLVFDLVHPASVLEIGCGDGAWLTMARRLGAERIFGVDEAQSDRLRLSAEEFDTATMSALGELPGPFDLAMCLEVASRLNETHAVQMVEALCDTADVVLFSSAIPGQGGFGHRNEQWPTYWEALFGAFDFRMVDCLRIRLWDDPMVDPCYAQNAMLYVRRARLEHDARLREARMENGMMPLCAVHPGMFSDFAKPSAPERPDPRPSLPTPRMWESLRDG